MLVISWFLCGMMFQYLYESLFCKMICKKRFELNTKSCIGIILIGILNALLFSINITYLKPILMHIGALIIIKFLYKEKVIKNLIWALFFLLLITISEFLFGLIFVLLLNLDLNNSNNDAFLNLFTNVSILIISYGVSSLAFIRNVLAFVINWYNKNEYKSLIIFTLLTFVIATFLLYNNFINVLPKSLLWFTNIFFIAVFIFVIGFFKEKTSRNKMIYEYDQLLDYVKTYEILLDEKSKNQHEYKNQLAVIRVMVKDKKTLEYIDSLLHNETEENLETINRLKYIPKGGLKGLIYYKIESMKKKKINVFVDVSSELKNNILWKKCDDNLQAISKILGVYLDNAIEAAESTKEKIVTLDVYLENKSIVFEISNTFNNNIDTEKIDDKGYSTKGKGHGYGLALVKDIINKLDCLEQTREINGNYYIQRLYIKK